MAEPFLKEYLMTAGPTPLPPAVSQAMAEPTIHHRAEWGSRVEPAELDRLLAESSDEVSVAFVTLSETSTGVVNDIQGLAEAAHRHGALLAVDAVSALGAIPVNQDPWKVDVVVAGSQKALVLELFGPEDERAAVVTAIRVPDGVDGGRIPKIMRDRYRIPVAGGQGQLKDRIVRIAHCGYFGAFDILTAVAALEMALGELGHDVELGAGVGAAQRTFLEAGGTAPPP